MRKQTPKFWKGLVVMCGDDPILIKKVERAYNTADIEFEYQDQNGTWKNRWE